MPVKIPLDTYAKGPLADAYGVSLDTLRTWLIRAKLPFANSKQKLFGPDEVAQIFEAIGPPTRIPQKRRKKKISD